MLKKIGPLVIVVAILLLALLNHSPSPEKETAEPSLGQESLHDHHSHHSHQLFKEHKAPTNKNKPNKLTAEEFEEAFKKAYPGDWTFEKDESGQSFRMKSASDGGIEVRDEQELIELFKNIASFMGLNDSEGSYVNKASERATKFSKTQVVIQKHGEYEVLNGKIQITKTEQGEVYMIENLLKSIDPDMQFTVKFNQASARAKVEAYYKDKVVTKMKSIFLNGPQIDTGRSPQELIWSFAVQLSAPVAVYEVNVGAQSGLITERSAGIDH